MTTPRKPASEEDQERPWVAIDANILEPGLTKDSTVNDRIRDRFRVTISERVADEVRDHGFHLPGFVEERTVHLDEARWRVATEDPLGGLSVPDVSLDKLVEDLRDEGQEAYLVTEDDELRDYADAAWLGGHLFRQALGEEGCRSRLGYVPRNPAPRQSKVIA